MNECKVLKTENVLINIYDDVIEIEKGENIKAFSGKAEIEYIDLSVENKEKYNQNDFATILHPCYNLGRYHLNGWDLSAKDSLEKRYEFLHVKDESEFLSDYDFMIEGKLKDILNYLKLDINNTLDYLVKSNARALGKYNIELKFTEGDIYKCRHCKEEMNEVDKCGCQEAHEEHLEMLQAMD